MTPQLFGRIVLNAQQLHEESWVKRRKAYRMDHFTAAVRACDYAGVDGRWAHLVWVLNTAAWNDVQSWANEVQT